MKAHLKAAAAVLAVVLVAAGVWWGWISSRSQSGASEADRAVETLPVFESTTLDGRKIKSSDFAGKVLIINFWATWCGPCLEEVPSLVKLAKEMPDKVHIIAVSNDFEKKEIEVFLKSFPEFQRPEIDIVFDAETQLGLSKQFQVLRLPESFIFSPQGRMVRKVAGSIDWGTAEAFEYLRGL